MLWSFLSLYNIIPLWCLSVFPSASIPSLHSPWWFCLSVLCSSFLALLSLCLSLFHYSFPSFDLPSFSVNSISLACLSFLLRFRSIFLALPFRILLSLNHPFVLISLLLVFPYYLLTWFLIFSCNLSVCVLLLCPSSTSVLFFFPLTEFAVWCCMT